MTAVTTAGLLAGLFGSAFVPTATAAGRAGAAQVVQASRTTIKVGSAVDCAGTQINATPATDTLAEVPKSCGVEGTDFTYVRKYGFKSASYFAGSAADDNGSLHFKFFTTTGAAFDFENGAGEDLALEATSSNDGILVAWAYTNLGVANACDADDDTADPEDVAAATDVIVGAPAASAAWQLCLFAATATTAATSTITIKADGVLAATVTVTAVGAVASVELSAYDVTDANGVFIAEENGNVANFWKIVAKDSAGTVINGKVGSPLVAADVSDDDLNFTNYTLNPKNQNGNAKLNGSVIQILEDGSTAAKASASAGYQLFELNDSDGAATGPCQEDTGTAGSGPNGDGDAGKTYSVKVSSGTVHSNAVTITCTSGFDAATVVSVAAVDNNWETVTGGALTYEDEYDDNAIYIVMNLKDGAGRQLGAGLTITRGDVEEAVSFGATLNWSSTALDDLLTDGSGQIVLGDISPAVATAKKYSYGIKAIVNAGAYAEGDDDDKVFKWFYLSYNAVDSSAAPIVPTVKRNALKRKATITVNCGLSDSMAVVPFDVELANGDLVAYDRKADINGVVKLVLNKRNTVVRVVALCTDGDSEVATVRFR